MFASVISNRIEKGFNAASVRAAFAAGYLPLPLHHLLPLYAGRTGRARSVPGFTG